MEELSERSFEGIDLALFSAGGSLSRRFAPLAIEAGAVVVDNSSAFRMDPEVPLVVPEINGGDIAAHRGIVANPNCTTAIAMMALGPLHRRFHLVRVWASSYQAVSGSGARAVEELRRQLGQAQRGEPASPEVYPHPIAHNVLPHVDSFLESGYTREEMKLEREGRRILHHPGLLASATCVRVPVYRAHSVALTAEFARPVDPGSAREALEAAPGIRVNDRPSENRYPLPLAVSGKDDCEVGRIRRDCALDNGLSLWVCGDQLLKGAALNAVQIAEALLSR